MKWCESEAIAAVMQVLTFFFFLEDSSAILRIRFVSLLLEMSLMPIVMSHMIGARKIRDLQKGDREAADSQRRGPRSTRFAKKGPAKQQVRKKGVREAKSLGTSELDHAAAKDIFEN